MTFIRRTYSVPIYWSSPFRATTYEQQFIISFAIFIASAACAVVVSLAMFPPVKLPAPAAIVRQFSGERAQVKAEIWPVVKKASAAHNISPELVWAVITAESNFNPRARSQKGAMGLMQLMPITARELQLENPLDPHENIYGGTRYLAKMLERFKGNPEKALAAYNAGPETVKRHGGIPPYTETKTYVKKVMKLYKAELAKRNSVVS